MSSGGHNPNSFVHKMSEAVIKHLILEDGVCNHTYAALATMLFPGTTVSEATIVTARQHLETCPTAGGYRLPYRMREALVLVDPDKNLTTLKDLRSERSAVVAKAFTSMHRQLDGMRERNIDGVQQLAIEARASTDNDLADALEQAVVDLQTTGTIHPATTRWLASLGVELAV